jgi:hypothetical protein
VKRAQKAGVALAASLLALASSLVLSSPAEAADNGAWSATPKQTRNDITPRQFFFYEVRDGQSIRDAITVVNSSEEQLVLDVFPADAFNVQSGAGFALNEKGKPNKDVGSWITMDKPRLVVPAKGRASVGFVMKVPSGVTPGDHAGGIVTLEPTPPEAPLAGNSQVKIRRALGVRMYVRIAGPLTPNLTLESMDLQAEPARLPFVGQQGGAVVTYTVKNSGNVRITADRVITLKGLFGRTLHNTGAGPIPEILPGSVVTLSETFSGMPVLDQVTARVELSAPTLQVTTSGDATQWVISIPFLVFALVILFALGFAVWWSRRDEDDLSGAYGSGTPPGAPLQGEGVTAQS